MKTHAFAVLTVIALLTTLSLGAATPYVAAQQATMAATMGGMGSATRETALVVTTEDGIPKDIDKSAWNKALGVAVMSMGSTGSDSIDVELSGLVPNGVYSTWWVNMTPSMSMGPAAKPPTNEVKADATGNASVKFTVPSNNNYQTLFVAYHADGKTHGDEPGKMGSETFSQLMGVFPGPGGQMPSLMGTPEPMGTQAAMMGERVTLAAVLKATTEDGVPKNINKDAWNQAIGVAAMSMGSTDTDTIVVRLGRLVPNGVYTLWWVNMKPSMSMGPAAKPPANSFKSDAHGNAVATFTAPSKNDYQTLFVAYHADGKTHGQEPGKMGSETFSHLMGAFPGPAGMAAEMMQPMETMAPTEAK